MAKTNTRSSYYWDRQRKKLKKIYKDKGITSCELRMGGCTGGYNLSFAHRHKRRYYTDTNLLGSFNQTILACINCHDKIEFKPKATEAYFRILRGEYDEITDQATLDK